MKIGWMASRLAATAYLVPFLFVYHPGLLIIGSPIQIAFALGIGVLATLSLEVGVIGYMIRPVPAWQRVAWLVATGLLVPSDWIYNVFGALLIMSLIILQIKAKKKHQKLIVKQDADQHSNAGQVRN